MRRVVVLGTGTGVGKTRVCVALLRELAGRGAETLGLKPIESGFSSRDDVAGESDAAALAMAATARPLQLSPRYGLRAPVSPHLAARAEGRTIDEHAAARWIAERETSVNPSISSHMAAWSVIETAGGVFSPLSETATNFELAQVLEPALWVLVAADSLGVLHDVSATLQAMRARQRLPDHLVLSQAREPDASTGSNSLELSGLGIATPSAVLTRNDDRGIAALVDRLLARH